MKVVCVCVRCVIAHVPLKVHFYLFFYVYARNSAPTEVLRKKKFLHLPEEEAVYQQKEAAITADENIFFLLTMYNNDTGGPAFSAFSSVNTTVVYCCQPRVSL